MMASGARHSDWHVVRGERSHHALPAFLGHEGAGIVESVGLQVTTPVTLDARDLMQEKTIIDSKYGAARPHIEFPGPINRYKAGQLKLDELISRQFPVEQVNEAFEVLAKEELARSVLLFE